MPWMPAMELNPLLRRAVELGASDIHLKVGVPPILRRDGALSPLEETAILVDRDMEALIEIVGKRSPERLETFKQTGDLDIAYQDEDLPRFRVNAFRQRGHISFAFRVIPKNVPNFEMLGLPAGLRRLAEEHRGLVLVTGATGSGKSTTLAAMVDHINRSRQQHIVTIEDPIEILHSDHSCIVNQREVGLDTPDFMQALRRALRQDPDVILIGELRDAETAQTALQAAESGHLVLSTLHTVDAAETIGRMVEFFPEGKQQMIRSIMAGVLRGVVSQRLLPRIDGGRIAAVEVMVTNTRIADLIRDNQPEAITDAIEDGSFFDMQSFSKALIDLVVSGQVDREVAANAATNRHDFIVTLEHALKQQKADVSAGERQARAEEEAQREAEPAPAEPEPEPEPSSRRSVSPKPATDAPPRRFGPRPRTAGRLGPGRRPTRPRFLHLFRCAAGACPRFAAERIGPQLTGIDLDPRLLHLCTREPPAGSGLDPAHPLAAGRLRLRDPLAGARLDQQDRVQLRPEHGPELGRCRGLDAVHALDLVALGPRRGR